MLTSLWALTPNVIEAGNETWTELLNAIADAEDVAEGEAARNGTMVINASSKTTRAFFSNDKERFVCFLLKSIATNSHLNLVF